MKPITRVGPDRVSPEYALVEELSRHAEGLLLLTATPEQLGRRAISRACACWTRIGT